MKDKNLLIALIMGILVGGGYLMSREPRGIRNNNPGNIKLTSDNWQGLKDIQDDPVFFQFISPVYGIRALARILLNYNRLYGLSTLNQIIDRFAPDTENPTNEYTAFVSAKMGIVAQADLMFDQTTMAALVSAIIEFENGKQPYSLDTIFEGVGLAYA